MRINSQDLLQSIEHCLDLSMDGRLSKENRSEMLALAKRLRGALVNLLTAEFRNDLTELQEANEKMIDINKRLLKTKEDIDRVANAIKALNSLLSKLDDLLKFATKFL
jgi:hypothetical protein